MVESLLFIFVACLIHSTKCVYFSRVLVLYACSVLPVVVIQSRQVCKFKFSIDIVRWTANTFSLPKDSLIVFFRISRVSFSKGKKASLLLNHLINAFGLSR